MGIKAVVFDVGDVVLREHTGRSRKKLAKKLGINTIKFKGFGKMKKDLKKMGVEI